MKYISQLDYAHLIYNHNMNNGGPKPGRNTVATSGCGLCSACMIVGLLTPKELTVEEAVRLSENNGANLQIGTDMKVLGPIVADKFNLAYAETDSGEELLEHLRKGSAAIVHVGGDREGHKGIFSNVGHYIVAVSANGNEVCILDPGGMREGKFEEEWRRDKVRLDLPFVYCDIKDLLDDTANRKPGFHLYSRKSQF